MEWCRKMVFPVRKAWLAVSARVKARKKGAGLLKLHDDIQTCGYEDVQIMWEMLRRTELELTLHNNKRKHQHQLLRTFTWFNKKNNLHNPTGAGLLKLHDDIQTCGYEDVKIMWEMLRRSELELTLHNNRRAGLLRLHDDIQTCGYEDVQIMWEMLRRAELELNTTQQ